MPRQIKKSFVWEVFEKQDSGKVVCKKCALSYKYSGNTSTMMAHIKNKHPAEYSDTVAEVTASRQSIQAESSTRQTGNSNIISQSGLEISEPPPKRVKQMRLCVPSKIHQKSIDDALIDMIVMDFQPIQIVENQGFQTFSHTLNPDYKLPSRQKLTQMLEEKYNIESAVVKQKLQKVDHLALTSDIWTSDSNKCFISITAHYIEHITIKSIVISTSELQESHTAQNIAQAIKTILEEWQLEDKIVTIVTDNASSMKKAVSEFLCKRNHFCVAHTLNLAVKDCIDKETTNLEDSVTNTQLTELLSKCRSIVGHFKHSTKSSYALKEMQTRLQQDLLKLKQDVRTRWNSTFYMLERLLKLKVPLSATLPLLDSPPSNLNSNEWLLIEDVVMLLQPFEKITTIVSGESYPTLSCIIPIVQGLQNSMRNKCPTTELGVQLKRNLLNVIEKRLAVYEHNRTAAKATFLDPRFKKKGFSYDVTAVSAEMWVIDELKGYYNADSLSSPDVQSSPLDTIEKDQDDIWGILDKKISEAATQMTPFTSAASAVKQYVDIPYVDRKTNPLEFWETNKNLFPLLYKLAHKYLCIPATSVPSERLFSKAGLLCNDRRNRLAPKKVDQILFLNSFKKTVC